MQPSPKKNGLELSATFHNDAEGQAMCWRAKRDGINNNRRVFVDIPMSGPHKGMLRLWQDREGMKKGEDITRNGKRKYTPGPVVLHANKGQWQVK